MNPDGTKNGLIDAVCLSGPSITMLLVLFTEGAAPPIPESLHAEGLRPHWGSHSTLEIIVTFAPVSIISSRCAVAFPLVNLQLSVGSSASTTSAQYIDGVC